MPGPRHWSSIWYGPKTTLGGYSLMVDPNEPIHLTGEQARSGATPHMTRYILGISLVLVILIFAFLLYR